MGPPLGQIASGRSGASWSRRIPTRSVRRRLWARCGCDVEGCCRAGNAAKRAGRDADVEMSFGLGIVRQNPASFVLWTK